MSYLKLIKVIEDSNQKITKPNTCYNSGIIDVLFKKNSGGHDFKKLRMSVIYGKPKQFALWSEDGKLFFEFTCSTSNLVLDDNIFKNKYFSIEAIN